MRPNRIITLFADPAPSRRHPHSVLISTLVHGMGFGFILLCMKSTPHIGAQPATQRYTVRLLEQRRVETKVSDSVATNIRMHAHQGEKRTSAPGGEQRPASLLAAQVARLRPALQTLVQPDAPPDLRLLQKTPIPVVVMWLPSISLSKKIIPPEPHEASVTDVLPSLAKPNQAMVLADFNMPPSAFPTETRLAPSSTTIPLIHHGPQPNNRAPQTASNPTESPTPTAVMSLSEIQTQEPVMVPLVNQTRQTATGESLNGRKSEKSSGSGSGNSASRKTGVTSDETSSGQTAKVISGNGSEHRSDVRIIGSDHDSAIESAPVNKAFVSHITLPKSGQFGVVVVGSTLAEQYPEVSGIWRGRLVYTVYLHVGLGKSWILQYSMPRAEDVAAGNIARPEAPWAYDIFLPHLAAEDYNSDAIMVHGLIDILGHFEQLAIIFPPGFTQSKFLLDALQQWQFRPARQLGKMVEVEILLIIPDPSE